MSPPPPLSTGRSVRVRLAAIGSSSAKMSSISSRRARREVGRRRTETLVALAACLEDFLGAGLGLEVVLVLGAVVVILGEAEVDERSMPGVSKGHLYRCFGLSRPTPLTDYRGG